MENLIKNSPWKEYSSNTNYAFDPYGETEEKNITSGTSTAQKDKSRNQRSTPNSQQTTLQMSHSPTSKSQLYYDNTANGGNSSGGPTRSNGNSTTNTQEYRSNGRSQRNGNANAAGNGNSSHYDRYDRNERNEQHHMQPSSTYSRNSYAERAYSLPRQQHNHQQQQANLQPSGYYTQDRRDRSAQRQAVNDERRQYRDRPREDPRLVSNGGADTPDFYFMPSQRKYSGEVVRVYVDYNKDPKH